MVEYALSLDNIFGCLADPTRRDILQRISDGEMSVGQIARPYDLTFAAVSKHLKVLEKASLIIKRRRGKEQLVSLAPEALAEALKYLQWYGQFMNERYDALEIIINKEN